MLGISNNSFVFNNSSGATFIFNIFLCGRISRRIGWFWEGFCGSGGAAPGLHSKSSLYLLTRIVKRQVVRLASECLRDGMAEGRARQERKGKPLLGEPTGQFWMSGDEFVHRRLEGGSRSLPVSHLQEADELFHRGSRRRGKFRNELIEICRTPVPPGRKSIHVC